MRAGAGEVTTADPISALAGFDAAALEREPQPVVLLDARGVLRWVNAAWSRDAPEVAARFGVGTSYFDGISGELRGHFEQLLRRCLTTHTPIEQPYECSTAEEVRDYQVRFLPLGDDAVLVIHSALATRPSDREAVEAVEADYRSADGMVTQCSHCRRIRRASGAGWDWVPDWVRSPPRHTSHGLCPVCIGVYWAR